MRAFGARFRDPNRINLRKAGRAAIVAPALFAFALGVLDNDDLALFAAFGSFAALVFGDFGGTMPGRTRAYLAVLVVGVGLVAGGTALSDTTVAAVVAMAAVGFAVVFLGSLGGYFAASSVTIVLAFVLAVMVPAPDGAIPERRSGIYIDLPRTGYQIVGTSPGSTPIHGSIKTG